MTSGYLTIPPTVRHYRVPEAVIAATETFLRERGSEGLEAVVLWLGVVRDETHAEVIVELIPPQIAYRSEDGVAVEIPDEAVAEIIRLLPPRVFVLCRVHSHPSDAYHSKTDDGNMLISHRGAISIVVPYFARAGIQLQECSVNELDECHRWRELVADEVTERFEVVA
jgi:hypothetical protein